MRSACARFVASFFVVLLLLLVIIGAGFARPYGVSKADAHASLNNYNLQFFTF